MTTTQEVRYRVKELPLAQWQATSHPDLADCQPTGLFPQAFADEYRDLHANLWQRILRLNGTICTIERLLRFPFDSVYGIGQMSFWNLVLQNFGETAILMLHSLVRDSGSDVHNIPMLCARIMHAPWCDQKLKELFQTTLKQRKFNQEIETIAKKIDHIRTNRIAHVLIENPIRPEDMLGVSISDIRAIFNATHAQFGALCFGSSYSTLTGDLIPRSRPEKTCLDKILDSVLRESYFVNEPERMGHFWPAIREARGPEYLRVLNECRTAIGLECA